jgi:arginase
MTVFRVPYHLDEHLPDLDLPGRSAQPITTDLPAGSTWDRMAALYQAVAAAVAPSAGAGQCPVVISGDCTTALGTVGGLQAAGLELGIVWFDAHGDVQTPETTASGYLGGMPLRLLTGYRPELIASRLGLRPVDEAAIVLAGARDLDPPEVTYLERSPIRRAEVTGLDPGVLPDRPLYVHVDIDVLDPGAVPGLRYPAPGGASAAQLAAALRILIGTGQVAGIGLACTWHPGHDAASRISSFVETGLGQALS